MALISQIIATWTYSKLLYQASPKQVRWHGWTFFYPTFFLVLFLHLLESHFAPFFSFVSDLLLKEQPGVGLAWFSHVTGSTFICLLISHTLFLSLNPILPVFSSNPIPFRMSFFILSSVQILQSNLLGQFQPLNMSPVMWHVQLFFVCLFLTLCFLLSTTSILPLLLFTIHHKSHAPVAYFILSAAQIIQVNRAGQWHPFNIVCYFISQEIESNNLQVVYFISFRFLSNNSGVSTLWVLHFFTLLSLTNHSCQTYFLYTLDQIKIP